MFCFRHRCIEHKHADHSRCLRRSVCAGPSSLQNTTTRQFRVVWMQGSFPPPSSLRISRSTLRSFSSPSGVALSRWVRLKLSRPANGYASLQLLPLDRWRVQADISRSDAAMSSRICHKYREILVACLFDYLYLFLFKISYPFHVWSYGRYHTAMLSYQSAPFLLLAVLFFAIRYLNRTDVKKIKGLPEIPGVPIFGNLLQLGSHHAKIGQEWAKKYGPVYQVRMGNRRIIFANTFDSVRNLWITNQSALISRPLLHTFHTVVSSSEGFTIGTSPWDESCKARRKAAATALNRPAVQSYMPIIDYESTKSIKEMLELSKQGTVDVDPNPYFQRYALSTSLTLNYGIKIEGNVDDKMLREITHVEREISNFRSTSNNWADYIPLMRIWPTNNVKPLEYKKRRGAYMNQLLNMLKDRIKEGTDKPCISGNIIKDPEAKLNDGESVDVFHRSGFTNVYS